MKMISTFILFICLLFSSFAFSNTDAPKPASTEISELVQWVQDNATVKLSLEESKKIVEATYIFSKLRDISHYVLLAMQRTESGFNKKARSGYGAKGLLQVVPRFHQDKLRGRNPYDEIVSLEVGTQVLKDCLDKFNNDLYKASNCYSGGGGKKYYNKLTSYKSELRQAVVLAQFENEEPIN